MTDNLSVLQLPSKVMVLPMVVYTSGFLHVGHVRSYANCDMLARWLRFIGKEVMFPFGYDSHGLPTELKAVEEGKNPITWTKECVRLMSNTLVQLNLSFDWERLINTSTPDYYLLQQHIFVKLYKHGFIYRALGTVNWDPVAKTTLANEQVIDGKSERTGATVELVEKEQWFLRLSDLAKELNDDLQDLVGHWPNLIINAQREWIGYEKVFEWSHKIGSDVRLYSEANLTNYSHLMVRDGILIDRLTRLGFKQERIKLNKRLSANEVWMSEGTEESLELPAGITDSKLVEYVALRDWCISRQRSFGCIIPACFCKNCGWVVDHSLVSSSPINEREFKPIKEFKDWVVVTCPKCNSTASREVDTLDTLFDSSWYPIKYCDLLKYSDNLGLHVDTRNVGYLPVSYYVGGREHATGHLMYIRGIFLCLHKIFNVIPKRPVVNFVMNGMITAPYYKDSKGNYVYLDEVKKKGERYMIDTQEVFEGPVEKMSKSKKNVVRAETLLKHFPSDMIRLAILSDYPIGKDYTWYANSVEKVRKSVRLFDSYLSKNLGKVNNLWWWSLTADGWRNLHVRNLTINQMFAKCEMNKIIAKVHEWVHHDLAKDTWCAVTLLVLATLMPEMTHSYLSDDTLRNLSLLIQSS